jgi:serine-protein kinase ATM
MNGEGWEVCTDFCIEALSHYLEGDGDSGPGSRASPAPGSNVGRAKSVAITQGTNQIGSQMAVDFLLCLSFLVSSTNAPVSRRAERIYQVALQVLQLRHMKIGELQKAAFSTLTSIVQRTQIEDVALTKRITRSLVPLLSYWWQPRALSRDAMLNSIRDEMLKTISVTHLYLEALLREPSEASLLQDTEELLDSLWSEYSRREEKARLQLDDISFTAIRLPGDYPRTAAFSLRPFHHAAEQNWALLESLAILESIYSRSCHGDHAQAEPGIDLPRKKRRMASSPNRLHQKMLSVDISVQLTALQLIPFLVKLRQLSLDDATEILNDIARCTPTKQSTAASWGMLAFSRYATLPDLTRISLLRFLIPLQCRCT